MDDIEGMKVFQSLENRLTDLGYPDLIQACLPLPHSLIPAVAALLKQTQDLRDTHTVVTVLHHQPELIWPHISPIEGHTVRTTGPLHRINLIKKDIELV